MSFLLTGLAEWKRLFRLVNIAVYLLACYNAKAILAIETQCFEGCKINNRKPKIWLRYTVG